MNMREEIKFHKNIFEISLFNLQDIKKAYMDVLGLNYINHLSINVINPENEIMFISAKPNTGINVCATDLWKFDKSISPLMYKNNTFYFWDACYQKQAFWKLKLAKEIENRIACGFVVVDKIGDYFLMYSYGLDYDSVELRNQVEDMQDYFINMGRHCFSRVQSIYEANSTDITLLENFPQRILL